jgi:hypothetical protein
LPCNGVILHVCAALEIAGAQRDSLRIYFGLPIG